MKVQRLIFISHPSGGKPLCCITDVVSAEEAVKGITDNPSFDLDVIDSLRAGRKIDLRHTYAGLNITGHLIATTAPNNSAQAKLQTGNSKLETSRRPA